MLLERIKKHFDLKASQEELRKIGNNFVTAGIVGVFINHYVGSNLATMLWASWSVSVIGIAALVLGLWRRNT